MNVRATKEGVDIELTPEDLMSLVEGGSVRMAPLSSSDERYVKIVLTGVELSDRPMTKQERAIKEMTGETPKEFFLRTHPMFKPTIPIKLKKKLGGMTHGNTK